MSSAPSEYIPKLGRIPILEPSPQVDGGRWPARAFAGEVVPFGAVAFREGHDLIGVAVELTDPSGTVAEHRMRLATPGLDDWTTLVQLPTTGSWSFRIKAWADDFGTWLAKARTKIPLGLDIEITLAEGELLLIRASGERSRTRSQRRMLEEAAFGMADAALLPAQRLAAAEDERVLDAVTEHPLESLTTFSAKRELLVERTRAGVGSWYEFFPRSIGATRHADGSWSSGTFRTAATRLPEIAAMGFDVVYLPPIHPIGEAYRKGRNNSLTAEPGEPGSPWAIGSADGGHDAIHPELGTLADFEYFLNKAAQNGLEVALDLALQASPDHPWVTAHPEWFTTLPDGSIAYAENPPKKYQDIYPVNFDNDPEGIRAEVLRIVELWIERGIRIFRVDNPHTKPLDFWEWLIRTINAAHPDVVFLAEAFTRPEVMQTLAKSAFQQSYSYFTWRNSKAELEEFVTTISTVTADYMRPNLFVNTPDILSEYLQFGGRPAFKVRAALAATLGGSWGVYSGFELYESVARPGAEEYLDNEKYEFRPRDYARAITSGDSLAPYLTMLNQARDAHPALRQLRNVTLHRSDDDAILVYSKHLDGAFTRSGRPDTVLVVANVDPHSARASVVHLELEALGLQPGTTFDVKDLVTGQRWSWRGDDYVRLDAFVEPVHILEVKGAAVDTEVSGA